ncbi:MAG: sporadic carbohydrate cluster 2OG-Fe(II) oxygenase [Bdellovibrionota bacterium]
MSNASFRPQLNELFEKGFTHVNFEMGDALMALQNEFFEMTRAQVSKELRSLQDLHLIIQPDVINSYRLNAITCLNQSTFKQLLIEKITPFFCSALGEDLAIQKSMNLMIAPPQDASSVLPLHTDTSVGHSPFELTMLFPLTPIEPAQNMFIMPLSAWQKNADTLLQKSENSIDFKSNFHYLNLKPEQAFVFWHHLPHGSHINNSDKTHWSINLRFKNIFTPYSDKGFAEYFTPHKLSPFNEFVYRETMLKCKK